MKAEQSPSMLREKDGWTGGGAGKKKERQKRGGREYAGYEDRRQNGCRWLEE